MLLFAHRRRMRSLPRAGYSAPSFGELRRDLRAMGLEAFCRHMVEATWSCEDGEAARARATKLAGDFDWRVKEWWEF